MMSRRSMAHTKETSEHPRPGGARRRFRIIASTGSWCCTSHKSYRDQIHTSSLPSPSSSKKMSGTPPPPENKMKHFKAINALPSQYPDFRTVLWTGRDSQLVVMTVPVGGDIGEEVHEVDQHLIFTSGKCKAIVAGEEAEVQAGDMVVVPQGTKHNFINTGPTPLCLFTVYAPAEHDPRSVHKTKEEGDKLEDDGKDEPPKWAKRK
ncbi:RmlC-like cupin domain-containing protein [Kockovaella imperatae]|uniref:RmlC-like cupin domain-containing protein n=1 Tax=Kockovaella imperatae TaxID=4999 RepID=A0A1Y1UA67_9TREE|nr:RmlC-like cupin domain-containing protein [Kockovaella imperatae]ORX34941.1 RmlC-like cupin domain-containing protein [Kockovaella imperatae]